MSLEAAEGEPAELPETAEHTVPAILVLSWTP